MTNMIAAVTVLAFIALTLMGMVDQAAVLGGFVPLRLAHPGLLADTDAVPVWLTPLSCTLIHAGWLHIGFNMLMLLFCGRQVEHVIAKRGLLLLYVAGAYGSTLAQWAVDPSSADPMVGASGAISAIVGTYALLYSRQQVRRIGPFSANIVRLAWLAAGWIAIQLMIGIATAQGAGGLGKIAIAAHIGGFLVGLLLTRPMLLWRFRKRPHAVR